jgi:hypothetical protein
VIREVRAAAGALLFFSLFYCGFFYQSFASNNFIAPSDSLDFGVAAYLSAPALWTDAMYSGYPIAADPQSLTWYPILHLTRSFGLDWNVFLIAAYILASTTMFVLVRRLTGSNLAGLFAGFGYGFSGVMLGHIGHFNQIHAAAWVPLALYGLYLIREGQHRAGAAVGSIAFALMWLAGHPQVPVYTSYLSAALVAGGLYIDRPSRDVVRARLIWTGGAMVLGFAIAAIAVLPMVELGELSRRSQSNWELYISKALPPRQLLGIALPFAFGGFWSDGEIAVPYFGLGAPAEYTGYVGMLPLALALAAPFVMSTQRRDAQLWLALVVLSALLCLGSVTPLGTLFYYMPGYASFRVPARHLFVVSLCISVLSGMAFADLTRRRDGWMRIALAVAATALGAALIFGALSAWASDVRALVGGNALYVRWALQWPAILVASLIGLALVAWFLGRSRVALMSFAALLIAGHVFDLGMLHYRMPGYRFVYADIRRSEAVPHPKVVALRDELRRTGERVLATDGSKNQFLLPNLTRPWNVPAASGTGSLGIERYLDVLGMGGPGDVYPETLMGEHRGVDLFAIRYAFVREGTPLAAQVASQTARWTALENVRYYEDDPDTFYTVFRNERPQPRAWCVSSVARVEPREALDSIRSGHLPRGAGEFRPEAVALVEADTLSSWQNQNVPSEPDSVLVQPGRREYAVTSSTPCLLVVGEVHYPWWRASIDDESAEIARVNHAMIGVPVPAGSHLVRLDLRPWTVWIGTAITAVALMLWAAIIAGGRRPHPYVP